MHFIHPIYFLLACLLLIAVPVIAIIAGVRRKKALKTLLGSSAEDSEAVKCSYAARRFRIFFLLMAMVFLALSATRPFWSSKMIPFESKGRDLLILFDVSKSMLSSDLAPSRLEHAKYILREIIKADPQDHFGLIAFAGSAYLTCPLTSDPVAFEQYVNELNPSLVPIGGTNLEKALTTAVRAFKVASNNNRAIILLTDGDELTGNSSKIINELKRRNIPLFIIGLGDPNTGAPVKDDDGNYRRDAQGKIITTKLNETSLQKLAVDSGGIYVRSSITDTGVDQITKRIDSLGTAQTANKGKKTLPVERFPLFLIASAIMLLFYYLIFESPANKNKATIVQLFLIATLALPLNIKAENQPPQQLLTVPYNNNSGTTLPIAPNNSTNDTNKTPIANNTATLPKVEEKLPQDPKELYNLALEKQKKNNPDAEKIYEEVLKKSDKVPTVRVKTLQNLGVNIHNKARAIVAKSLQDVKSQQLDNALNTLTAAQEQLKGAEELYSRALAVANTPNLNLSATSSNLQQLALDKKKIEDLKKQIEELKKQQQKAQQQAQKAKEQQQDKQKQQQQDKNNKSSQDKKEQKQNQQQDKNNKSSQDKKEQKQQQNNSSQDAIKEASKEAQKLQEQAQNLKQDNLAKAAQKAKEELDKASLANQENKNKEAQKHIDEAIKALGNEKNKEQQQNKQNSDKNKDNKDKQQKSTQQQQNAQNNEQQNAQQMKNKPKAEDLKNAQELLKLLNDEENQRRKDLQRNSNRRRMQVEKDW